ncbi:MAG TPA: hypothetical protein PL033_06670 [Candidatus Brocadiia bacterium]|nr:hypothetical protein [Candidatus Brocadiia bacterium]
MKANPATDRIIRKMQPGVLTRDGFLGEDDRSLKELTDSDDFAVRKMELTHSGIANRIEYLAEVGRKGYGTPMLYMGAYEITVEEVKGRIACPWGRCGTFQKGTVKIHNVNTDMTIVTTPLGIHMIREHGFYQGKGSPYRLDPYTLRWTLW